MLTTRIGSVAATSLLVATGFFGMGGTAMAAVPSLTGCPAGFDTLSVQWLESQSPNYHLPRRLDEGGNQDGYVCGKPRNDQAAENFCNGPSPVPQLYDFQENDRTPGH
jgi:hypothetical protein